jgi:peptidoglycan/LPS O-acetylase OafA/YrhL
MEPAQPRPRLLELSSLRFFAAVYIFLFHARAMQVLARAGMPEWFQRFSSLGYVAVSFFFVLSGFVLVYAYSGRKIQLLPFLRSRLARLYPAYLFSLLLAAPFFFFAINLLDIPNLRWFAAHQAVTVFLQLTVLQAWVPRAALGWNAPGWALSAFLFFYVIFPALSKRLGRISLRKIFLVTAASWLLALGLALAYVVFNPDHVPDVNPYHGQFTDTLFWLNLLKFNPLMRLPEFLVGVALGFLVLRRRPNPARSSLFIGNGIFSLALLLAASPWIPYPILHTGLSAPAFALIIYGFAAPPRWTSVLASKPLVMLGDASLSFYLLHANITGMIAFRHGPDTPVGWGKIIAALLTTTVASLLLYRWYEVPARKRFDPDRRLRVEKREAVAASVGAPVA